MTVATQVKKVTALGNGVASIFSFSPLVIYRGSDLVVTLVSTTGVETVLTEGTGAANYSVSITEFPATGSIVYPATGATRLQTGESVVMKRVLILEQALDLENQGGYHPDELEPALDKLLMIDLQQQELLDRAIKVPISDPGIFNYQMPIPTDTMYLQAFAGGFRWATLSVSTAAASDTTPGNVSTAAGNAGVGVNFSRNDHVHKLNVTANVAAILAALDYSAIRTLLSLVTGVAATNVPVLDAGALLPLSTTPQRIRNGAQLALYALAR